MLSEAEFRYHVSVWRKFVSKLLIKLLKVSQVPIHIYIYIYIYMQKYMVYTYIYSYIYYYIYIFFAQSVVGSYYSCGRQYLSYPAGWIGWIGSSIQEKSPHQCQELTYVLVIVHLNLIRLQTRMHSHSLTIHPSRDAEIPRRLCCPLRP